MKNTQLILVEGPPGSGKTSTSEHLYKKIINKKKNCYVYLENDPLHPIFDENSIFLTLAFSRMPSQLIQKKWLKLVHRSQLSQSINIMESCLWQNNTMLQLLKDQPVEDIIEKQQNIVETIKLLNPVLIYFTYDNLCTNFTKTFQTRGKQWQQMMYTIFNNQKWSKKRGLTNYEGILIFFKEWFKLALELFDRLPFQKIKINNPHDDWSFALNNIDAFLELNPKTALIHQPQNTFGDAISL